MNRTCFLEICGVLRATSYGIYVDGKDLSALLCQALGEGAEFAGSVALTVTDLSRPAQITRLEGAGE